jgi:hypothetical protein
MTASFSLGPLGRLINELVGFMSRHGTVTGEQWPHDALVVLVWAVLDVADVVFGLGIAHFPPSVIIGFDNRHQA